jgi:hypothetical protein
MMDMRIKQFFFDRHAVLGAVDSATRRVLSKFGAFVRTAAIRLRTSNVSTIYPSGDGSLDARMRERSLS